MMWIGNKTMSSMRRLESIFVFTRVFNLRYIFSKSFVLFYKASSTISRLLYQRYPIGRHRGIKCTGFALLATNPAPWQARTNVLAGVSLSRNARRLLVEDTASHNEQDCICALDRRVFVPDYPIHKL